MKYLGLPKSLPNFKYNLKTYNYYEKHKKSKQGEVNFSS